MAEFSSDQFRADEDFDESIWLEFNLFERFVSSSLLASFVLSGSLDHYSCEEVLEDTLIDR